VIGHGGTLLLDEVAELAPRIQASLLRAVQQGEVTPVGATTPIGVDVRLISTTRANLAEEVRQGRFREDLYYRLVVVGIVLPPLRERVGDIPLLAMHFLDLHCETKRKNVRGFRSAVMQAIESYAWPGNVRELENEIERLVVLAEDNDKIPLELLSPHIRGSGLISSGIELAPDDAFWCPTAQPFDSAMDSLSAWLVRRALEQAGGVVSKAAQLLGMERTRLVKMKARLGM
jgi:DNA-binding NtrC family response regulator